MTRTTVATDGSCRRNPGPGGWAWVTEDGESDFGAKRNTTNNEMELAAIYQAIVTLDGPLLILSDSQYAINAVTVWWRKWEQRGWRTGGGSPVSNERLIKAILRVKQGRDIGFEWVRGHNGHPLNEVADVLAGAAY